MIPKVSVIVAIYNAETTLHRCLDSLEAQTLQDLEYILIDDGSTDTSLAICRHYQAKDSRFRVFNQENKGVSQARQYGLDLSQGEYVIYLDSDDYALPDAYASLYDKAQDKKADIVYSDFIKIRRNGLFRENPFIPKCTLKKMMDDTIRNNRGFVWNHLFRKSILDKFKIRFPENMQFGEDQYFLISLLSKCIRFSFPLSIAYLDQVTICHDMIANTSSLTNLKAYAKSEAKYRWWKATGDLIDERNAGRSYYSALVADAFYAFWNRIITKEEFYKRYSPYSHKIREHAVFNSRFCLVYLASIGHYDLAQKLRMTCSFAIILDKIKQKKNAITHRIK